MATSDQRIKADILMRIRRDSRINDAMIDVKVKNGLVTLTGMVSSYKKKLALQLKTKQTKGSLRNHRSATRCQVLGEQPGGSRLLKRILSTGLEIEAPKYQLRIHYLPTFKFAFNATHKEIAENTNRRYVSNQNGNENNDTVAIGKRRDDDR